MSFDLHDSNEDFWHHDDTMVATDVVDIPLELPHVSAQVLDTWDVEYDWNSYQLESVM